MVDIVDGCLILAYRHMLMYFDAYKYMAGGIMADAHIVVNVALEDCHVVKLKKDKKIFCLQEIGQTESCVVIEDLVTREVRFLRFDTHEPNGDGVK